MYCGFIQLHYSLIRKRKSFYVARLCIPYGGWISPYSIIQTLLEDNSYSPGLLYYCVNRRALVYKPLVSNFSPNHNHCI